MTVAEGPAPSHQILSGEPPRGRRVLVRRHALTVRLTHWINVLCLSILLMSGLQIFNAHPELYWGKYGADADHSFLALEAVNDNGTLKGVTRVGSIELPTSGVLGASFINGQMRPRGFPTWITLPSLRDLPQGRRWHFFFAWFFVINGLVYLLYGFFAGHFRRDLAPSRDQLKPRRLLHEIATHARLRFPKGEEARRYNSLQKLAYIAVIFILLPLMVLTGLTMSPGFDAAVPWIVDVFGGRQSARSIHFITASLLVAFVVVHIAMVVASGLWNNIRSMITGRYTIETREKGE